MLSLFTQNFLYSCHHMISQSIGGHVTYPPMMLSLFTQNFLYSCHHMISQSIGGHVTYPPVVLSLFPKNFLYSHHHMVSHVGVMWLTLQWCSPFSPRISSIPAITWSVGQLGVMWLTLQWCSPFSQRISSIPTITWSVMWGSCDLPSNDALPFHPEFPLFLPSHDQSVNWGSCDLPSSGALPFPKEFPLFPPSHGQSCGGHVGVMWLTLQWCSPFSPRISSIPAITWSVNWGSCDLPSSGALPFREEFPLFPPSHGQSCGGHMTYPPVVLSLFTKNFLYSHHHMVSHVGVIWLTLQWCSPFSRRIFSIPTITWSVMWGSYDLPSSGALPFHQELPLFLPSYDQSCGGSFDLPSNDALPFPPEFPLFRPSHDQSCGGHVTYPPVVLSLFPQNFLYSCHHMISHMRVYFFTHQ